MPVLKSSAMDPGGAWQDDAIDQRDRWNAQRGDQWTQFNTQINQRNAQDAWQKEVALRKLGLDREMWQGGREDARTGADRHYGYLEKELGQRGQESAAERALRERDLNMGERRFNFDMTQAEAEAERGRKKESEAERRRAALAALAQDPTAWSDTKTLASRLGGIDPEYGMPMLVDKLMAEERRKAAQEGLAAEQVPELLKSTDPMERKRGEALAAKAKLDPALFTPARIGQTNPQQVIERDPAVSNAIEDAAAAANEQSAVGWGDSTEAAAAKNAELWALAQQKAEEWGADPRQLMRLMYAAIQSKIQGAGFMGNVGRAIVNVGGLIDDPRTEYAKGVLNQR